MLVHRKKLENLRSTARNARHKRQFVCVRWLLRTWAAMEDELPVGKNSARRIPFNSFHLHLSHSLIALLFSASAGRLSSETSHREALQPRGGRIRPLSPVHDRRAVSVGDEVLRYLPVLTPRQCAQP